MNDMIRYICPMCIRHFPRATPYTPMLNVIYAVQRSACCCGCCSLWSVCALETGIVYFNCYSIGMSSKKRFRHDKYS